MSSLSVKNLKNYVVLGIAVAAAYIFFQKDQIFLYRPHRRPLHRRQAPNDPGLFPPGQICRLL